MVPSRPPGWGLVAMGCGSRRVQPMLFMLSRNEDEAMIGEDEQGTRGWWKPGDVEGVMEGVAYWGPRVSRWRVSGWGGR